MATKSEFLTSLDKCSNQDEWENIYAAASVEFTHDDASEVFASDKPYANWFGFRFEAGPPGVPLPSFEKAMQRVLRDADGDALDAFQIIFNERPFPGDLPPEVVCAIMNNCAIFALKKGTNYFGTWLGARAGLASLALGKPEQAWRMLDLLTPSGRRHLNLRHLDFFEALRGHPHLESNLLIRFTILIQWPNFDVPLFPQLPDLPQDPTSNMDELYLHNTLEQLVKIGAGHIAQLTANTINFHTGRQKV